MHSRRGTTRLHSQSRTGAPQQTVASYHGELGGRLRDQRVQGRRLPSETREPARDCVHRCDERIAERIQAVIANTSVEVLRRPLESAEYASEIYRALLATHGLLAR